MKKVVLRGPALVNSGYGTHCRQVARWLLSKKNIDVKFMLTPWGNCPWYLNKNDLNGLVGEIMDKSVTPQDQQTFDVSFQLQLPNEWNSKLATQHNVGMSAMIETDKANPLWVTACNTMSVVVVPSQHAKNCLTAVGALTTPVLVVPESYHDAIRELHTNNIDFDFDTSFNFLIFGQLSGTSPQTDRKNIMYSIKWLCEKFKDDPDVGIVIKTNTGRNTNIDRHRVINILKQLLSEVRKGPYPHVHLLHGDMSDEEVAALYKHEKIKALVAITKGEGFGLPILEAAASGLPIIATGWSGHMDFLKHGKFINVDYKLEELHSTRIDNAMFMQGAKWAMPLEKDFKERVYKFRNHSTTPKEWAETLKHKIIETHSFESISKQYDEAVGDLIC